MGRGASAILGVVLNLLQNAGRSLRLRLLSNDLVGRFDFDPVPIAACAGAGTRGVARISAKRHAPLVDNPVVDPENEPSMSDPLFEKADVFLPGQGDALTQAPAYRWERVEGAVGNVYFSTTEPRTALLQLDGMAKPEVQALADLPMEVDRTGRRHHEFEGFGVHLPGLIVTARGTAIGVCQRRHGSMADCGHPIDILMAQSEDAGKTWQRQQVIFEQEGAAAILGPILEVRATGVVLVPFWKMSIGVTNDLGYFHKHAEHGGIFWLLESSDDGRTWSAPRHVAPQPNGKGWIGWPNNCVHGIELARGPHTGRLVMPAFLYKEGAPGQVPGVRGGLLYSDDRAQTWRTGAVLPDGSDEVSLVQTTRDSIYVSYRKNTRATGKRHFARSGDGGETFSQHGEHQDLPCRNLHAGLTGHASLGRAGGHVLLCSSPPAGNPARNMTIYLSQDEGATWPIAKVIEREPCRYSDLAIAADGTILCLYTTGRNRDTEKISVARFNLDWLLAPD